MSQTECGLCVAVMLMEYYDVRITLNDIPKEFSAGRDGTRIRGLKKIFDHFGFSINMFKVTDRLSEKTPRYQASLIESEDILS